MLPTPISSILCLSRKLLKESLSSHFFVKVYKYFSDKTSNGLGGKSQLRFRRGSPERPIKDGSNKTNFLQFNFWIWYYIIWLGLYCFKLSCLIQWRSEIQPFENRKHSKSGQFRVQIWMANKQNGNHFVLNHLKTGQNVQFLNNKYAK